MGLQAKANFIGIVTATGKLSASVGALRIADNVTLRRKGALTVRQHYTQSVALSRPYRAVYWFQGTRFYVADLNVLYTTGQALVTLPTNPTGTSYNPVRADIMSSEESRKNLYFATKNGILKLVSGASTAALNTGTVPSDAYISFVSVVADPPGDWLAANSQVAYRVVVKHTDANGLVLRSRPSGATIVTNTSGSVQTPSLYVQLVPTVALNAVHEVEIYRTRTFPNTVQPDDEMQLVASIKASAFGSPSNAYIFRDKVPDTARTTTLYTSPSRGGIENANDRPPGAAVIEGYRGHLFFGNTVGPQRYTFSYKFSKTDLAGQTTGIGFRTTTGNLSNGLTTITNVANTTGIQRGMIVMNISSGTPGNATVTNISGTTITVSIPAGVSQTAAPLTFYDAVGIDGSWYPLGYNGLAPSVVTHLGTGLATLTAYEITPPSPGYDVTLVIEHKARGQAPFQVLGTHGAEMNPPVAEYGGTGTPSTNDVLIHGLAWSEPDEPEHVPPKNFARVGDGSKAILGLTAMRDSLLIWKEDGIFRLTGAVSSGFRIDPFSPSSICILPMSIRRLRGSTFALTSTGLCEVTEAAAETVSGAIEPDLARLVIEPIRQDFATNGLYRVPTSLTPCVCATANESNGEYWLMIGQPWNTEFGVGHILVYDFEMKGFTTYTWTGLPTGLGQNQLGQPVFMLSTGLHEVSTATGANLITVRAGTHGFYEPGLTGKLWTHMLAGFSVIEDSASVQMVCKSSESQTDTSTTVAFEVPLVGGRVVFPNGTLLRQLLPRAMARAWMVFLELVVDTGGNKNLVIETIGIESRENAPNKNQTTASGAT